MGSATRHSDAVETVEPEEVAAAADAEQIRAGIRARRDQRRQRKRHRIFVAIALVVAAVITAVAYRATSNNDHNRDTSAVNSGADNTDNSDEVTEPATDETPPPTAAAGSTDFQPTAGAVEWVNTPAAEPAETPRVTAPPGTRPCTAFQISAKGSWQPTGGMLVGGVRFTDTSGSPCSLHGVPEVRLTDDTQLGPTTLEWEAGGPSSNAGITVTAS